MNSEGKKRGYCDYCEDSKDNIIECPEHSEPIKRRIERNHTYCEACCKDNFDNRNCFGSCEYDFIEEHKARVVKDICESEHFVCADEHLYVNSDNHIMISPNKFNKTYEINPLFVESPVLVDEYAVFKGENELHIYDMGDYIFLYKLLKNKFKESITHFLQSEKVTDTDKISLLKLEGEFVSGIIAPIESPEIKARIKDNYLEQLKNSKFALQNISVSEKEKDIIRIATVQLDFELSDSFPFEIQNKVQTIDTIYSALEKANEKDVDIICFPELSFCEDWLPAIKEKYSNMLIIAGTYYYRGNNVCQILIDSDKRIPPQSKAEPSASEKGEYVQKMISGEFLNIYETRCGKFSVLICRDFPVHIHRLKGIVDIVFVPSYNRGTDRFSLTAHTHVGDNPSYVIISNSSKYGGTSIFGIVHESILGELFEVGYKINDDKTYNLCEIEKGIEGIIIADFNIVHKSIQVPTPSDPSFIIKTVQNIDKIML